MATIALPGSNHIKEPPPKKQCPRNGKRGQFFERRFLFSQDTWISFQLDFRIFLGFFKGTMDSVFRTLDFGWFNTGIRFGFSDFGLWTLNGFSIGRWIT